MFISSSTTSFQLNFKDNFFICFMYFISKLLCVEFYKTMSPKIKCRGPIEHTERELCLASSFTCLSKPEEPEELPSSCHLCCTSLPSKFTLFWYVQSRPFNTSQSARACCVKLTSTSFAHDISFSWSLYFLHGLHCLPSSPSVTSLSPLTSPRDDGNEEW